jgi:hypothetical protein
VGKAEIFTFHNALDLSTVYIATYTVNTGTTSTAGKAAEA